MSILALSMISINAALRMKIKAYKIFVNFLLIKKKLTERYKKTTFRITGKTAK